MRCVVASDLGSSACKTVVVADDGRVLAEASRELMTHHPRPGWAEQDPDDWLAAAQRTTAEAMARADVPPQSVEAYGLVGVTHNAVLMDDTGRTIRPSIQLFDERSQAQCAQIEARFGAEVFARARNAVSPMWTWPQLKWLREHEPRALGRTAHLLFQKDWVRQRLTGGAPVTDPIDAAGSLLFDPVAGQWIAAFADDAGLGPEALPALAAPTAIVGRLEPGAAARMGLAQGTPVIAGTTDTAAEILGAGATAARQGTIKLASVGRIAAVAPAPAGDPRLINYRHVLDGLWYPGTASKYAASAYRWLRDALGPGADFGAMSDEAAATPVGARGLLFLPHLGGQWAPSWDPARRGAFVGLDAGHRRGDLCRAVMEGVAFALRDALACARGAGLAIDELRLLGGGAMSPLWTQILADVLALPLVVPAQRSAAWGAAVLCGMATGLFPRDAEGLRRMMVVEARHEPQPGRVAAYEGLYAVWRDADAALAPVSHALRRWRETAGPVAEGGRG